MTQDPYQLQENDLELSAMSDSGDEYDGLDLAEAEPRKSRRKTSPALIALFMLIVLGGAGFVTYELFLKGSDMAVDQPLNPLPDPAATAETPATPEQPADTATMPEGVTTPGDPAATGVTAEAVPAPDGSVNTTASDTLGEAPAPTAPPAEQVAADATTVPAETPVSDPAVTATEAATTETTPTETAMAANTNAATGEATTTTVTTTTQPVENPDPAATTPSVATTTVIETKPAGAESAPAAAVDPATMPPPPAAQLQPIDANPAQPAANKAGMPSPEDTTAKMNAINEILGSDVAVTPQAAKSLAEQVEVTPRAKQVIVVKKNYSAHSPQAVVAAGDRVLQSGEYAAAAEIYDRQLKKNPSDPLALAGKAESLQRAGQTQEAMDTYQRLIDLNPRDIESLTNYLGLLQKQNPEQALTRLKMLEQQYPENAAVAGQLGMAHARMLDTPNALRYFNKATALDPKNPTYPFNLAVLYDRLGTVSRARDYYREALDLIRNYPDRGNAVPVETIRTRLGTIGN